MNRNSVIEVKDLSVGYSGRKGDTFVLKGLNFELPGGSLVGIVGKNGIGKSTLLRTLCRLQKSLSGEIYINGQNIDTLNGSLFAKLVAVVLTDKISGFNLTVEDLVSSGRVPYTDHFHRLTDNDIQIINQSIQNCNIQDQRKKLLSKLSDGLLQKALIAKGLAQQTDVLLLDEPTAFLDFPSKHQIFELLKRLSVEKNKCVIISSHDIDLVLKYTTHLLIIDDNSKYEFIATSDAVKSEMFNKITAGYFK